MKFSNVYPCYVTKVKKKGRTKEELDQIITGKEFNFKIYTVKNSIKYYCFIVIILLSISCNKTDSYENLNLLIENEWNLFSREKNNINIIENCDLDDRLLFENSSIFTYDFGVLNCFENENKKTGLKWKIVDNHTTLRLKYRINQSYLRSVLIEYWKIIEINDSLLILEDALAEDNGQNPEIRIYKN